MTTSVQAEKAFSLSTPLRAMASTPVTRYVPSRLARTSAVTSAEDW